MPRGPPGAGKETFIRTGPFFRLSLYGKAPQRVAGEPGVAGPEADYAFLFTV
jgi:hypothetical protein